MAGISEVSKTYQSRKTLRLRRFAPAHLVVRRQDAPEGGHQVLAEARRVGRHLLVKLLYDRLQGAHQVVVVHLRGSEGRV